MRVINRNKLDEFRIKHANARDALATWYDFALHADWKKPEDLARDYTWDAVLPGSRAVFKIKGNDYRLLVRINYALQVLDIRFIGTHAEYDKIDATKI